MSTHSIYHATENICYEFCTSMGLNHKYVWEGVQKYKVDILSFLERLDAIDPEDIEKRLVVSEELLLAIRPF